MLRTWKEDFFHKYLENRYLSKITSMLSLLIAGRIIEIG